MKRVKGYGEHDKWLSWLGKETEGFDVAIEFGAGFFNRLNSVNCPLKVGIELFEPYIRNATCVDCIKVCGDMRRYRELLPSLRGSKVAMFIDSLEHLRKKDAIELIGKVKEDFDKIVLMVPNGNIEQHIDVTGFGNHKGQTHRSRWFEDDLLRLGFDGFVDNEFHKDKKDKRCYFVVWSKYENTDHRK